MCTTVTLLYAWEHLKEIISNENRKARLELAIKYRDEAHKFWDKILWTDATKINLYQSDGNVLMCGERKGMLMIPNTQAQGNELDVSGLAKSVSRFKLC